MKKKHPRNLRFMLAGLLLITLCIAAAFYEWPYKKDALEQINSTPLSSQVSSDK